MPPRNAKTNISADKMIIHVSIFLCFLNIKNLLNESSLNMCVTIPVVAIHIAPLITINNIPNPFIFAPFLYFLYWFF